MAIHGFVFEKIYKTGRWAPFASGWVYLRKPGAAAIRTLKKNKKNCF